MPIACRAHNIMTDPHLHLLSHNCIRCPVNGDYNEGYDDYDDDDDDDDDNEDDDGDDSNNNVDLIKCLSP